VHVQEGGRADAAEPSLQLEPVRRSEDGLVHAHDQQVSRPLLGRVGDRDERVTGGQLQGRDGVYGEGRPLRQRFHPARPRKVSRGEQFSKAAGGHAQSWGAGRCGRGGGGISTHAPWAFFLRVRCNCNIIFMTDLPIGW
jgi:hypothetical protein